MPLYSDSSYYYSSNNSPLYSSYYSPGLYSVPSTSAATSYGLYTSNYTRPFGSSYGVPPALPRSPSYSSHSLLSSSSSSLSRYQPKLSTITESSPLINSSHQSSLTTLTRIPSPKYSGYSSSPTSSVHLPKYVPPRPILINTADIDVSASRYRKQRDEAKARLKQDLESTTVSPTSSQKRRDHPEQKDDQRSRDESDPKTVRSTIRRDRAVVRLSTFRSRDRISPEVVKRPSELPEPNEEHVSWRQKLAEDLAAIPSYPIRKSPGDLLRERFLIQNVVSDQEAKKDADIRVPNLPRETIEQVVLEIDPIHHKIRRLSIPQCPTFHDICEDISSDKIDDDLNAGELRRRASIIQEHEQELLNQLQSSSSNAIQLIHLERRGSHESQDELPHSRQSKSKAKKGKNVRHKITAIVEVENGPSSPTILERDDDSVTSAATKRSLKPRFTFNVETVEEHNEIEKIFKLPKKKSLKKTAGGHEKALPAGSVIAEPQVKEPPKKAKILKKNAAFGKPDIFTFDKEVIDESKKVEELRKPTEKEKELSSSRLGQEQKASKSEIENPIKQKQLTAEESVLGTAPKSPAAKVEEKSVQKSNLVDIKLKLPAEEPVLGIGPKSSAAKVEEKSVQKPNLIDIKSKIPTTLPKQKLEQTIVEQKATMGKKKPATDLKSSESPENRTDSEPSLKVEESKTQTAKPKPIKKSIQRSDSGEDFWALIGSRETLYMDNRKKTLLGSQWQKCEDLFDATTSDEVKNLDEMKGLATSQKAEAVEEAEPENARTESSHSNKSSLTQRSSPKIKEVHQTEMDKVDFNSQEKKTEKSVLVEKANKMRTLKELAQSEAVNRKESKPDEAIVPKLVNEKTQKATTPTIKRTPEDSCKTTTITTTKTAKTTETPTAARPPEIDFGQKAKSPEQTEQNKSTTATAVAAAAAAAKVSGSHKMFNNKATVAELAQTTAPSAPETWGEPVDRAATTAVTAITAQPETVPAKLTEAALPSRCEAKAPATRPKVAGKTAKSPPTVAKGQTAPNTINAELFFTDVPAKVVALPAKSGIASPAAAAAAAAAATVAPTTTKTTEKTKTRTTTALATSETTTTTTTTTNTITTATDVAKVSEVADVADVAEVADVDAAVGVKGESDTSGDAVLTKFATVSNLAQCLHDVDADLEDYIPSSAQISEEDGSECNLSSADGCENLSASMKKKLKQRRKKEREAAQQAVRFDPQKKIKIDTSNKCYVKEEKPRYPLVATPRPLWRREKVVYSDEDTSDESDSEEDGSTDETDDTDDDNDDSDECSTSDEYEDGAARGKTEGEATKGGGSNASKASSSIIRMSTCSNDSGFVGGTAPSSPKKMLETSYTYAQFQKSGRFTAPARVIPRFKDYNVDDFHFLAVLGKGSFGKVLLAELRDTTYYYAVKCLKKDVVLEDDDVDSTLIERKVLALGTKHPYLCHLFCTFQTESHLFFVMEYLNGGDLMFHIQESGRFPEERARFYGAEIISGLKFLHKKGIIYRDLKLDNILLDYEGHVRIADFGMCKLQIYLDKTADSFCGTPDYMAPEIIKGEKYNQNVDWWSFGVLLYEMLIGQSPFSGCDEDELFWSICNEIPWFPVYISTEATSILKGLLEKDYTKRIGSPYSLAGDISDHIFFRPIDWKLLEKRQIEPPFRPQVKHPLDTQYFDRVFTRERVRLTPIDKEILQSMDQKQFLGFTYTNPHITLD